MGAVLWVVGAIVLMAGLLLAVDWFTAGRSRGRTLVRAKDQSSDNAAVGYAVTERNPRPDQQSGGGGLGI
jgi:hypothetical protein